MKKHIKYISARLFLIFLINVSCNNDDDIVAPPVDDTAIQDPDDTVDDDTDPDGTTEDAPEIGDYLALQALYEANPGNTLGWDLNDTIMGSWNGVILNNDKRVAQLDVEGKSVASIVPDIGDLDALLVLNLNANDIVDIPEEIARLSKLRELYLEKNIFKELPAQIGSLKSLEALYLFSNPIEKLPVEIGGLFNLKKLDANFCNSLKELPSEIGNLSAIEELDFGNSSTLAELPEEMGELKTLKFLNIKGTDIIGLQSKICDLTVAGTIIEKDSQAFCYDSLEADYYAMVSLLDANPKLEAELEWDRNDTTMQSWGGVELFAQQNLVRVKEVVIGKKSLIIIPSEIQFLSQMATLSLSRNFIQSIPSEIGNLTNLENLFLDDNQLVEIPESIGNLTQLQVLYLHGNPDLSSIPQSVCDLETDYGTTIIFPTNASCN